MVRQQPIPLFRSTILPTFPVEALPGWLRLQCELVADELQVPVDLPAMLGLAMVAASVSRKVRMEVRTRWVEPLCLYVVVVAGVAERKSAVFSLMSAPLYSLEQELRAEMAGQVREMKLLKKAAETRAKQAEDRFIEVELTDASEQARENARRSAERAREECEQIVVPALVRLVVDDSTPEALPGVMAANGERIALLSSEPSIFEHLAGRYNDGRLNVELFLKAHTGETHQVDRKGSEPVFLRSPELTIALAVQPVVVEGLTKRREFRHRGVIGRLLFSLPASLVGTRAVEPALRDDSIVKAYDAKIRALGRMLRTGPEVQSAPSPHVLKLSRAAHAQLVDSMASLECRLGPDGDLDWMADWAGKLPGATARIAGVLHLANLGPPGLDQDVAAEHMEDALVIARYLLDHANAAFDVMGADEHMLKARKVEEWLRKEKRLQVTKRDVYSHSRHRSLFRKAADVDPVLEILAQHSIIEAVERPKKTGPGHPASPLYLVNPLIFRSEDETARDLRSASAGTSAGSGNPTAGGV